MNIKKIYTQNGKVIKEYFVHKEDAKEVASKLGIGDDLVETLENILSTDEFIVVENEGGFSLSKDGKMVSFDIIAGYLNSEAANSKPIVVGDNENPTVNSEEVVDESLDEK
jgi:enolase